MGECLITRRGGESYELPILNPSYPQNVTVTQAATVTATFSVIISTPGKPAQYTYQWYLNGSPISGATSATYTHNAYRAVGTYSIYCAVTNKAGTVNSRTATFTVKSYLPTYSYSGSAQLIDDGNYNWRLKLLTSGQLTFSHLGSGASAVDVFLVGGGGGGGSKTLYYSGGGGGGYTKTVQRTIQQQSAYQIIIGAGGATAARGGTTSALNATADGGFGPGEDAYTGGAGGSGGGSGHPSSGATGGAGGSDGNNGAAAYRNGGAGQGTTTREFGEASGALYAGGGGGSGNGAGGAGGAGGGGKAANPWGIGNSGTPNTGGGSGGNWTGGNANTTGGSGIVIIRNHR